MEPNEKYPYQIIVPVDNYFSIKRSLESSFGKQGGRYIVYVLFDTSIIEFKNKQDLLVCKLLLSEYV